MVALVHHSTDNKEDGTWEHLERCRLNQFLLSALWATSFSPHWWPRIEHHDVPLCKFQGWPFSTATQWLMLSACLISTCKTRGYISHRKSPMVPSSMQGALRLAISRRNKPGSATFGHHCMTLPAACHSRGTSQTYAVLWPVITNACFRMLS